MGQLMVFNNIQPILMSYTAQVTALWGAVDLSHVLWMRMIKNNSESVIAGRRQGGGTNGKAPSASNPQATKSGGQWHPFTWLLVRHLYKSVSLQVKGRPKLDFIWCRNLSAAPQPQSRSTLATVQAQSRSPLALAISAPPAPGDLSCQVGVRMSRKNHHRWM